ncbi:hypothetical protein BDW42DRAFT_175513 [Aspergillus taichungensis]|uniref:Uncharacterized protein n=1 Tax=Aspergillus taichungensis TaxID=482145 RepID=A0A2J5HLW4_9EURO|nr:hypothetical protein BDW42DRAFT_175513 [Aspergillus taichungensis]
MAFSPPPKMYQLALSLGRPSCTTAVILVAKRDHIVSNRRLRGAGNNTPEFYLVRLSFGTSERDISEKSSFYMLKACV